MILVDSNILIDITSNDPVWFVWSSKQIVQLMLVEDLAVNQIVVAEVAPSMGSMEAFYTLLTSLSVELSSLNEDVAFMAGSAFLAYRKNGGKGRSTLPDFFIGAHAQHMGASILTRDSRFYRAYFPSVPLISPEIAV
jgi:predicted nucleic acid-binding protein